MKKRTLTTYQTVQWYSASEWKKVFNLIFGPESDDSMKREALQILLVWKCRNPSLPAGIESTLCLLEVDMQHGADGEKSETSDRLLRLMYSSAIMRFVNHTLDDAQNKRLTLLQAAVNANIPQWIIDLRHETAHGHQLPSLNILKNAARFSMNWLYRFYWEPMSETITDVVVKRSADLFQDDISKLITVHNTILLIMHSETGVKNLSDISNEQYRTNLYDLLSSLLNGRKKINRLSDIAGALLKVIQSYMDEHGHVTNKNVIFAKAVTGHESLFMSGEYNDRDGRVTMWKDMLLLVLKLDLMPSLVKELLSIASDSEETAQRRNDAATWIKDIYGGFSKTNSVSAASHSLKKHKTSNNIKGSGFNFEESAPYEISKLSFVQETVKQINPLSKIYMEEMLRSAQPPLDSETILNLFTLVDIMSDNNCAPPKNDRIYTADDVASMCSIKSDSDLMGPEKNDDDVVWQIYSGNCEWGKYPIGILPWQSHNADNPTM